MPRKDGIAIRAAFKAFRIYTKSVRSPFATFSKEAVTVRCGRRRRRSI